MPDCDSGAVDCSWSLPGRGNHADIARSFQLPPLFRFSEPNLFRPPPNLGFVATEQLPRARGHTPGPSDARHDRHMDRTLDAAHDYASDVTDREWALLAPHLPAARPGGRPRSACLRRVVNAVFYLLQTGCQWRMLPRDFPPRSTVYGYFRAWIAAGVWAHVHRPRAGRKGRSRTRLAICATRCSGPSRG